MMKTMPEEIACFGETINFTKPGEQAFISHTKKDQEFCGVIEKAIKDVGFRSFRTSFEELKRPEWKSIQKEINNANVLILVLGRN